MTPDRESAEMTPLSDSTIDRLRRATDWPDLSGTRYEPIELLGRGGMGSVYRALDRELQRDVAIKVLADPEPDADAVARLIAEARIMAGLEHPGIVPVHDVGTLPDGRVFYAMKRVSGTRLDAAVRGNPSLAERLRLFERVCEPVAFAHAHGVIHRDLKPQNVMVGAFGEVLVMDWGLARMSYRDAAREPSGAPTPVAAQPSAFELSAARRTTSTGTVLGTPGYMAPEQARGDNAAVDARSDIHALGGLLHFLVTGVDPEPYAAPNGSLASTTPAPRPLVAVWRKAMAHDPAARYPDVAALMADVERFRSQVAVHAHRESAFERAGRVIHRFRVPIGLVGAYLIMRVLLLVVLRR